MDQKIFTKFSIYDQIGYLMVGSVGLLLLVFNGFYFIRLNIPPFNSNTLLVWLVLAYFLGHLLQGIANVITDIPVIRHLIREDKGSFNDKEKEILEQARGYFGLEKQDENKLWNLCYVLAMAKDVTGQVQAFNAYYSLYRGWLVVFLLQSLFLIYVLITDYSSKTLLIFTVNSFFVFLFYRRLNRFWNYTRNKAFETFIIVKTSKL